jgi:HD-like signal output (HDOD) protein
MTCTGSRDPVLWKRLTDATDRLPPFSPVLNRLLATLADEDVGLGELAVLIEKDTVLAGNVLRLVNSALYGRRGTVNSVRHAVSLMGVQKLRNFALGFSISQMWSHLRMPRKWSAREFNMHSVACAVLSDLVALEAGVPYAEGAFVGGLLHDIGRLVIAIAFPNEFDTIEAIDGVSCEDDERDLLGITHSEVSGAVLERWNLPMPIQRAVANHHRPEHANGGQFHLAHILYAADAFLGHFGHRFAASASNDHTVYSEPLERLGLAEKIPDILANCQLEFEALSSLM